MNIDLGLAWPNKPALKVTTAAECSYIDQAPIGIFYTDEQGRCTYVNKRWIQLSGMTFESAMDLGWTKAIHPEDRELVFNSRAATTDTNEAFKTEYRIVNPNGKVTWVLAQGEAVRDGNGQFIGYIGTVDDIEEQKGLYKALQTKSNELEVLNEKLRSTVQMLELVMDSIPQHIVWKDRNSVYLGCNKNFARLLGLESPSDVVGKNDYDLSIKKEDADFYVECDERVMSRGKPEYHLIEPQLQPDGSEAWLDTTKVPLVDKSGKVTGILVAGEDITERMKNEQALIKAKKFAENAAIMKSRFLDIAAHELRTPVTVLSLLLQMTQKKLNAGTPVAATTLTRLHAQSNKISRLVIDLLDVSRLENGKVKLNLMRSDLNSVISECVGDLKLYAPNRSVTIVTPEIPIELEFDQLRISQVLTNILDNACKYTPADSPIEISTEKKSDSVRVAICDRGPGISEDQQTVLFCPLTRDESKLTSAYGGLGLGLFLSSEIIKLHGGTIGVISKIGEGSTFYFDLPIKGKK